MGVVMIVMMLLLLSKDRLLVPKGGVMVVVAAVITHLQVLIRIADSGENYRIQITGFKVGLVQ